jgi:hypothetical protein
MMYLFSRLNSKSYVTMFYWDRRFYWVFNFQFENTHSSSWTSTYLTLYLTALRAC